MHWLLLAAPEAAAPRRRTHQQLLNDPPVLAFGAAPGDPPPAAALDARPGTPGRGAGLRRSWSLSGGAELPSAAHLLTVLRTAPRRLLVRVAHLLEAEEVGGEQGPSTLVDLDALLRPLGCAGGGEELSLSANQARGAAERRRLRFRSGEALGGGRVESGTGVDEGRPAAAWNSTRQAVELRPMEIRTFELEC